MSVYEFLVRHGADYAQGVVVLGVVIAGYVGWRALSVAVDWLQYDVAAANWDAIMAKEGSEQALREVEALKTRVKSLEDAAARSKQRDAEKKQVRIAKIGGAA